MEHQFLKHMQKWKRKSRNRFFIWYYLSMKIIINDSSIKVGQLLKKIGAISTGGQAKMFLETNVVKIGDKLVETRGTKINVGNIIWINDDLYQILNKK